MYFQGDENNSGGGQDASSGGQDAVEIKDPVSGDSPTDGSKDSLPDAGSKTADGKGRI